MSKCDHMCTYKRRVGPTGNKDWMILVNQCGRCAFIIPVYPDTLTYQQKKWVDRYNKRIEKEMEKK